MMWHGDWTGAEWVLMGLGMLAFWTLVVAAVLWVLSTARAGSSSPPQQTGSEPPAGTATAARAILDERFARGELTEDEYRSRRDLLASR